MASAGYVETLRLHVAGGGASGLRSARASKPPDKGDPTMSPATPRPSSAGRAPAKPRLTKERTHFKELLLANHFGTIPGSKLKAKAKATGNTNFEQLMCIGYQPEL